jgi:hypothetical protein
MFSVAVLIGRGLDYKLLREQSFDCYADPLLFDMQLSKDSPLFWGLYLPLSGGYRGGVHPFPFRTRKLSSPAPKILDEQLSGKIGHRQINVKKPLCSLSIAAFLFVLASLFVFGVECCQRKLSIRAINYPSWRLRQLSGGQNTEFASTVIDLPFLERSAEGFRDG